MPVHQPSRMRVAIRAGIASIHGGSSALAKVRAFHWMMPSSRKPQCDRSGATAFRTFMRWRLAPHRISILHCRHANRWFILKGLIVTLVSQIGSCSTTTLVRQLLSAPGEPPKFLLNGGRALKPYGVLQRLEQKVSSGRAAPDSGFALLHVFEHDGRWYGMTTEHDLVALDRVRVIVPSVFHGIELPPETGGLPAGFVEKDQLPEFRILPDGSMMTKKTLTK